MYSQLNRILKKEKVESVDTLSLISSSAKAQLFQQLLLHQLY
jgi:hypothetical protein